MCGDGPEIKSLELRKETLRRHRRVNGKCPRPRLARAISGQIKGPFAKLWRSTITGKHRGVVGVEEETQARSYRLFVEVYATAISKGVSQHEFAPRRYNFASYGADGAQICREGMRQVRWMPPDED